MTHHNNQLIGKYRDYAVYFSAYRKSYYAINNQTRIRSNFFTSPSILFMAIDDDAAGD